MTKTKKIFTTLSCIMLLAVLSVCCFMVVGCAGEDTTVLTTSLSESVQEFTVGTAKTSVSDWGVTFTPSYDIEMQLTDGTKETVGPNSDTTSLELTSYADLVKYNFTVSGFNTSTVTKVAESGETEVAGVHYRVCTITYLGKQTSFKYTVK